jgi:hypothetical protein
MTEPGARVGALQNLTETQAFMFGWGVYEGDFPRPNPLQYPPEVLAEQIRRANEELHPVIRRKIRRRMTLDGRSDDEIAARLKEYNGEVAAANDMPMEERVADLQRRLNLNPRIKLDDGRGTVWGYQCWWGAEDDVRSRIDGREIVLVEPPGVD